MPIQRYAGNVPPKNLLGLIDSLVFSSKTKKLIILFNKQVMSVIMQNKQTKKHFSVLESTLVTEC